MNDLLMLRRGSGSRRSDIGFWRKANVKAELAQWREVGTTLACPQSGTYAWKHASAEERRGPAVVIVDRVDRDQTLMCHTTMTPARPVPCWRVDEPADAATMVGALDTDEQSGLTVRGRHVTPTAVWTRRLDSLGARAAQALGFNDADHDPPTVDG
jgi:hypothetical protein